MRPTTIAGAGRTRVVLSEHAKRQSAGPTSRRPLHRLGAAVVNDKDFKLFARIFERAKGREACFERLNPVVSGDN
jgi:hypothetical protein